MYKIISLIISLSILTSPALADTLDCPKDFTIINYRTAKICVTNDYWYEDGIRKPVNAKRAEEIAKIKNSILPTKKLVDIIWNAADLKLSPKPMKPTGEMTSLRYAILHNEKIDKQIGNKTFKLVAGHKKDIIQRTRQDRVTIYGWHYLSGKPIQPKSSVHGWKYADYSHGLRLIYNKGMLDNKIVNIEEIIDKLNL